VLWLVDEHSSVLAFFRSLDNSGESFMVIPLDAPF
jgi:hypothetical protein